MTRMKNSLIKLSAGIVLFASSMCCFGNSSLFTVTTSGSTLTIATTILNHTYPNAGIKITSAGYSLTNPGSDCTSNANGYCTFSVSNTAPHDIAISGASGTVNYTLCLNGLGALSCQNYQATITSGPSVAYVANQGNNQVYRCPIDAEGMLGVCASTGNGFNEPLDIAINAAGSFAYITNSNANTISICPINNDQSFGTCTTASQNLYSPVGIALNSTNTMAYVTNVGADTVSRCPVNLDGSLGTCIDSGVFSVFDNPEGIVLNANNTKAYIVNNGNSTISVCTINDDGSFDSCQDSENTGVAFNYPELLTLNSDGTLAYIANSDSENGQGTVSICPIEQNGLFGACTYSGNTGTSFNTPKGISLTTSGSTAYVSNDGDDSLSKCPVNEDGSFGSCESAGNTGLSFSNPWGIVLI